MSYVISVVSNDVMPCLVNCVYLKCDMNCVYLANVMAVLKRVE